MIDSGFETIFNSKGIGRGRRVIHRIREEWFESIKDAALDGDTTRLFERIMETFSQRSKIWLASLKSLAPSERVNLEALLSWNHVSPTCALFD